ncbi:MAG: type II secretion system protein [Akkermansiaceae bacterium]
MQSPKNPTRYPLGFTLVELLVTLVMIAALAALFLLGVSKAKNAADMTTSLSRIRGFALANSSYASDHNNRYVSNASWDENGESLGNWSRNPEFLSYIVGESAYQDRDSNTGKLAKVLPEVLLDPVVYRSRQHNWNKICASYGYVIQGVEPSGWRQKGMDKFRTIQHVTFPARSAAFITAKDWNAKYRGRFLWKDNPTEGYLPTGDIAYRYNGKCLVVFFDGHAESLTMIDMKRIDEDKGGAKSHFWDADGPWE